MSESQFLEKLYDLIGEYTYKNPRYEDIIAGRHISYSNGEDFSITVEIYKTS